MSEKVIINRLPTRTWNRLGVNETALEWGTTADLGTESIVAAGQTARLDIADGGESGEKTVDIHAPEGQTVTVFETMKAESDLLVRTAIRAGHHCAQPLLAYLKHPSTARASLAFYNTEAEIDRLLDSLSTLRERMGYGK